MKSEGDKRIARLMSLRLKLCGCVLVTVFCAACISAPGRPSRDSAALAPDQVLNFTTLYRGNCAGCHGSDGKGGAAIALSDPIFLTIADDDDIRRTTAGGMNGTPMPAFAQSAGGTLTDQQIDAIVRGVRTWAKPELLRSVSPPPYAQTQGDLRRGEVAYSTYCSSCHGPNGTGGLKASSIVNPSYLALVSDQYLRIAVIAGRRELGMPDWRNDVPGRPMSSQEVSDLVVWLSAQRTTFPGPPHFNSSANHSAGEPQ
jgi:cytochrome c oxidase cbb3-type subunit III